MGRASLACACGRYACAMARWKVAGVGIHYACLQAGTLGTSKPSTLPSSLQGSVHTPPTDATNALPYISTPGAEALHHPSPFHIVHLSDARLFWRRRPIIVVCTHFVPLSSISRKIGQGAQDASFSHFLLDASSMCTWSVSNFLGYYSLFTAVLRAGPRARAHPFLLGIKR